MSVTTVLGQVEPSDLGRVDCHEHVFLRSPILPGDDFQDLEKMAEEVHLVRASGIETVVDLTPIGLGRRPFWTAEVSRRTGVSIIMATGAHRHAHYPRGHWLYEISVDELTDLMVADLSEGIDDRDWQGPRPQASTVRAGIIKLGASYHSIAASEQRWFEAGVAAALLTGVSIAVHCEVGTAMHQVLDRLQELGLPAGRVLLAHADRNLDLGLHLELAERGAFLGYDTIGRTKYHADERIIELIGHVTQHGAGGQVLLGTDVGRSSMLRAYGGGPGMDVLGREFLPRVRRILGEETSRNLMVANPARFLATRDAASHTLDD